MRLVFFGTPEIAVPSLDALARRHEVTAVVCQPDRPRGRGKKLEPPPVKVRALEHGLPVHQPVRLHDGAFEEWLRGQNPEVCAITAYGRLLRQPVLDVPPHGFINMHPSLLPRWRGPSPVQSAVLAGDDETGVSIMKLTLDMDAGPILLQERAPVSPDEPADMLSARLAVLGAQLLADALDRIDGGTAAFEPQDDARATYCTLLTKEDGYLDWNQPARTLHNQVRGCQPWPTAQCRLHGAVLKVHAAESVDSPADQPPGTVVLVDKQRLHVATGNGALSILAIQAPGKRAMPIAEFLRGHRIEPGERFEPVE